MVRNEVSALTNSPTMNLLLFTVNEIAEKSGIPPNAPISGITKLLTNAVTTLPNATPITTPTAISTTLPFRIKFLNP